MSQIGFKQARRRYFRLFWPTMIVYMAIIIGGKFWLNQYEVEPIWLKAGMGIAASLPLFVVLWVMLRYAFETDEYQGRVQIEGMAISGVVITAAIFFLGFLQLFDALPEFSVFWFGPAFMVVHGITVLLRGGRDCL